VIASSRPDARYAAGVFVYPIELQVHGLDSWGAPL
jgi:hypothetical protein